MLESIDDIAIKYPHLEIKIIWIPGHMEIEGNEHADAEAKKAATDITLRQRHNYKPLKSAHARSIKALAKKQWHTAWSKNTKTAIAL